MTVKELYRLNDIKKLIARNVTRLAEINAKLDPSSMTFTGMPHNPAYENMTEATLALLIDIKKEIEQQQMEYFREQSRLEKYIRSVDDYQMRLIMSLRFVDMLTWRQVAQRIGGGNTEDGVRMACKRYVERNSA